MRVLMLSKACVVGAYQRKLEELARFDDIELCVVVPPSWRDAARGELHLERTHVNGYDLRVSPVRFNGNFHLHYFPQFGREVRRFAPDIVHIDEEPYNLATWHALWIARRAGAKTLFFSWQNIQRSYPVPFRWGEKWVTNSVDYALMGTQSAADIWRAKGYTGPLAVVPQFGVDPELFTPASRRDENKPFTVGFVGRLVEEKGGADLLDALAQLDSPWQLEIVGDGPEKSRLQAQAAQLNIAARITFNTLPSTEMPVYYQRLDALAIPSLTRDNWKEQFGRVIVEAMACGVPVIGSTSGAIPDVIGGAGMLFPEGNSEALAGSLRQLMQSRALRQQLAEHGRRRVLDRFTQAQVAAQTAEAYRAMTDAE